MSGTLQHHSHGTLPPVPLPRLNLQAQLANRAASTHSMRPLDNSSSSDEEDKADLLGRNFQVPRPKSRSNASIAVSINYLDYIKFWHHNSGYNFVNNFDVSLFSLTEEQFFFNYIFINIYFFVLEPKWHLLRRRLWSKWNLQANWWYPFKYVQYGTPTIFQKLNKFLDYNFCT